MNNLEVQETEHGRLSVVHQRCCPRRWVASLFKSLRACSHDWSISGTNGLGHPSEKICISCGEYRHKIYDHWIMGREEWKIGKHPKSKTMNKNETPENRPQDGRICDCEDAPCCGHYDL